MARTTSARATGVAPSTAQASWEQVPAWPQSVMRELRFHWQQAEILVEAARHLRDGQALQHLADEPRFLQANDDLRNAVAHASEEATWHANEVEQGLWRSLKTATGLQAGERVDFAASRTQLAGAGGAVRLEISSIELVADIRGELAPCVLGARLLKSGLPGKRRAKAILRQGREFRRL